MHNLSCFRVIQWFKIMKSLKCEEQERKLSVRKNETDLESVMVTPYPSKFSDNTIELVLADLVPFFFPFVYSSDGVPLRVNEAQ